MEILFLFQCCGQKYSIHEHVEHHIITRVFCFVLECRFSQIHFWGGCQKGTIWNDYNFIIVFLRDHLRKVGRIFGVDFFVILPVVD